MKWSTSVLYNFAQQATMDHSQGDSLINLMLIIVFELFRPDGHQEPHNEVAPMPSQVPSGVWTKNLLIPILKTLTH